MLNTQFNKCLVGICLILVTTLTYPVPKKDLWPIWQKNNPQATTTIDYSLYQAFLTKYVVMNNTGPNLVLYSKVSKADLNNLAHFLQGLAQVKISTYNQTEQLAYWINLYNALTIYVVLEHYPVKSILDIKLSGIFSTGPWDKKLIQVEGQSLSLNDIEHRIIRPIWHDERTHYALNCASYSCPNLQMYTGATLDSMLNQAAIDYVNSPRGVVIQQNKLKVSSIYDWYQSDFGTNQSQVIGSIAKYAKPELKAQLLKFSKINDYIYNWNLNGAN